MNRFAASLLLLLTGGITLANLLFADVVNRPEAELKRFSYTQLQMAMPMQLTVWCESEEAAQESCKLAFDRASELVKIFSDYDPDSEINRLLNSEIGVPHPVSRELFEVLSFSQQLHQDSGGAFDPAAGQLTALWRKARRAGELPDPSLLQPMPNEAGLDRLKLDRQNQSVTLRSRRMRLDFGGVAKGYIGDQVIELLRKQNIHSAKYHAGGDIVLSASPPNNTDGWKIQVTDTDGSVVQRRLSDCGLSMSGDLNQHLEADGVRYSHAVDPRSGFGINSGRWAVVVAPSGMQSDAIATTGCILDDNELQQLAMRYSGTSAWSNFGTPEN